MTAPTNEFPRETAGLPAASATATVELSDGDRFALRIAPVTKRIGDATVRMLAYNGSIPGPTLQGRAGLRDRRRRRERGRSGGDRPLARAAAGEPLRRHARDAGADPGRRQLHLPRPVPGPGRLLVPPAHPRGLRPGDGPLRQRPRRPVRPRLLGAGQPRARAHARRRPHRGRQGRAVQPRPRPRTPRWGASATCCSSPASRSWRSPRRHGEVVRLYLTNTANTRVFKVALPGARMKLVGGDSGRVRARGVRRGGRAGAVGARRRRRAVRDARRARRWSTARPTGPTRSPRSRSSEERGDAVAGERVRGAAQRPGADRRARTARAAARRAAGQDARVRRRDGHGRARRRPTARRLRAARCTPRSSATSPAAARSAA